MKLLPNKCRYSDPAVFPKNWETKKADLSLTWNITYRFYDDNLKKVKLVMVKGLAGYKTLNDRQQAINAKLVIIKRNLEEYGYNPITKQQSKLYGVGDSDELSKNTLFIPALRKAAKMLKISEAGMAGETLWVIGQIEKACKALNYDNLAAWDVTLKQLHQMSEKAAHLKDKTYSPAKFNRCKKVLMSLYKKLVLNEAAPFNFPLSLERQKEPAKKKKEGFTKEEREKLDTYLSSDPRLARHRLYVRIFYHSGARSTEMLRVKGEDVDLKDQTVMYLVLKGKQFEYKTRPILDIALPFWIEAMQGVGPKDYVFGAGFQAGPKPMTKNAVKLWWERVQEKTGIKKGMYELKHSHSTGVRKQVGIGGAAMLNAESEEMIRKHYDTEIEADEMNKLRKVRVEW